jgi:hypothetical protein
VNTGVVTRALDERGRERNFYGIIQNILKFRFAGNKKLKVFFFDCEWFHKDRGIRENEFGMVEVKQSERAKGNDSFVLAHQCEQVYYMPYPCEKLDAWWVVYKANPRERLYAPSEAGYQPDTTDVNEIYQDEEASPSFDVDSGLGLDSLVGDPEDVTLPEKQKRDTNARNVKRRKRLVDRDVDGF